MEKCDGQVEGRLKHFFSITRLNFSGLATAIRPAEATESAEEKPKQAMFMCRKEGRREAIRKGLRPQVRAWIAIYPHPSAKISTYWLGSWLEAA